MCVCLSVCPSVLKLIIFMAQILKQSVSNQSESTQSTQKAIREQSECTQRATRELKLESYSGASKYCVLFQINSPGS